MKLDMDRRLAAQYRSGAQRARVLTEAWVGSNMFCPRCGRSRVEHFANNRPVADFFCPDCGSQYELKSGSGPLGKKVMDGAYETMIERITSNQNPDFFFLRYEKDRMQVTDLIMIPKYFFSPAMIEKRPPLPATARRAGWVGCNIVLERIPVQGRIDIITNGAVIPRREIMEKVSFGQRLATGDIAARGWLMDVLHCVNRIPAQVFSLQDVYLFEEELSMLHQNNNNVRPKIRQQLQVLRDKGFLEFLGNGRYRKTDL